MFAERLSTVWLIAVVAWCGISGVSCGSAAPYQREYLARPSMDTTNDAQATKFRTHVHESREGASGGNNQAGGGCGCN